jgi:hypothetical protein
MKTLEAQNIYCPICESRRGKKKLLFRMFPGTTGRIAAYCKECRKEILIDLEPLSRE